MFHYSTQSPKYITYKRKVLKMYLKAPYRFHHRKRSHHRNKNTFGTKKKTKPNQLIKFSYLKAFWVLSTLLRNSKANVYYRMEKKEVYSNFHFNSIFIPFSGSPQCIMVPVQLYLDKLSKFKCIPMNEKYKKKIFSQISGFFICHYGNHWIISAWVKIKLLLIIPLINVASCLSDGL